MGTAEHVVGYGWADGRPHLRLAERDTGHTLSGRLTLRLELERRCIGWVDYERRGAARRRPCPTRATPSGAQCIACSHREGFWLCMTCDGFQCPPLPPSTHEYCRQDHHLYLASFGGPALKVGTASHPRRDARLVEQGPLAALRVARGPGPLIKQMEALAVGMGFVEAMRRAEKWRQFRTRTTPDQALTWLEDGAARLRRGLPAHYHALLHEEPARVEQPTLQRQTSGLSAVEMVQLRPGETLAGQVVGARGHVVVLDDGAGRVALDIGALKAWFVTLDPTDPGRAPTRQLGLF